MDQHVAPDRLEIQPLDDDPAVPLDIEIDFIMRMVVIKYGLDGRIHKVIGFEFPPGGI